MMFRTLFISNFKKYIKVITWVVVFTALFCIFTSFLNYKYVSFSDADTESRIFWYGFYNRENVDNLIVGSSHVYCDINPDILDNLSGESNANLATPAQLMHQTYYTIKEANRVQDIKKVYIEMYYYYTTGKEADYSTDEAMKTSWRTTDYMSKWSPLRYVTIVNTNDSEHLIEALFPFVRFRKYIFSESYIEQVEEQKRRSDFQNYTYHIEGSDGIYFKYLQNGYLSTNYQMNFSNAITADKIPDEMVLSEEPRYYLQKCIDYCKKNDIEIVLFVSPIWDSQLIATENYDSYRESVAKFAELNEVKFYDFNLCKPSFMKLDSNQFRDSGHLNDSGAELFTEKFYEIVNKNDINARDYFFESYEEKLKSIEPEVFGIYVRNSNTDEEIRQALVDSKETWGFIEPEEENVIDTTNVKTLNIASSNKELLEFEIYLTTIQEDIKGNKIKVSEFSDNTSIVVDEEETGVCTVVYRLKGKPESERILEFNYSANEKE